MNYNFENLHFLNIKKLSNISSYLIRRIIYWSNSSQNYL